MQKRLLAMTLEDHLLVTQLLGHISGRGARHLNPRLGEEGTGDQHEGHVEEGMERVLPDRRNAGRRRRVVGKSTNWHGSATLVVLPLSKQVHKHVGLEAA